jgi:DNA-binding MarR family transcriptional regulator
MKEITERQRAVLRAIHQATSPSLSELGRALDIGTRGAHDHVIALERKGYITRRYVAGQAAERSIELTSRGYVALDMTPPESRAERLAGLLIRAVEIIKRHGVETPLLEDVMKELGA